MAPIRLAVNALTLPTHLAGIGYYTLNLLEALAGFPDIGSVTLFTNGEAAGNFPRLPEKCRVEALPARGIAAKIAAYHVGLSRRLRGFDILHSVGNVACLGTRMPQVCTVHDLCNKVIPGRFGTVKRRYLDWGIGRTVARRDTILCVSESTRKDLIRFYPQSAPLARTVHSACKFPVDETAGGPRRGLLFVGTLEPGKNLDFALRVLARLRGRGGEAVLKVVGAKGWKQSHIPGQVDSLGLGGAVEFAGYLDDEALRRAYRTAEALFFPSAYEGFGFPILEAQSQGCPVIAADNSSLREVGGDAGRYFRDGDLEGAEALLRKCLEGGEDFRSARELGFANCRRFSWENTARGTLEVYRRALG